MTSWAVAGLTGCNGSSVSSSKCHLLVSDIHAAANMKSKPNSTHKTFGYIIIWALTSISRTNLCLQTNSDHFYFLLLQTNSRCICIQPETICKLQKQRNLCILILICNKIFFFTQVFWLNLIYTFTFVLDLLVMMVNLVPAPKTSLFEFPVFTQQDMAWHKLITWPTMPSLSWTEQWTEF